MIEEEHDRIALVRSLVTSAMSMYVPDLDKGKELYFIFVRPDARTHGGLVMRPALTSYYKSDKFCSRPFDAYSVYTSPTATILCTDYFQSMYTQLLCGLLARLQVHRIGATFASGLLHAIHFLQLHWQSLAHDIETGTLSDRVTDPSVRHSLAGILSSPNPGLAKFIVDECSKDDWGGIITRLWPNTKFLRAVVTGTMAQYIPNLEYYSGGRLPVASTVYASSECTFGLNLRPMCKPSEVSYTIMPNMGYFEFLPVDSDISSVPPPKLVDLADVEVGKEYELVVTTYPGVYRYQVGDILRVTGFHNSAPEFRFVRRKNVVLSIDVEKTDENELQRAVERAAELIKPYGASVADYTSKTATSVIPGHYVVYWELVPVTDPTQVRPSDDVLDKCCLEMEEAMSLLYRKLRVADGKIGPLEIRVVKSGTFEELMNYYVISRGVSISQFKVPRCVRYAPIIELLDSRVESTHFSPSSPKWTPNNPSD